MNRRFLLVTAGVTATTVLGAGCLTEREPTEERESEETDSEGSSGGSDTESDDEGSTADESTRDDGIENGDGGGTITEPKYEVAESELSFTDAGEAKLGSSGAVVIEDSTEAEELLVADETLELFVSETDFEEEVLVVGRVVAPQGCYRARLDDVTLDEGILEGTLTPERTAAEDEPCTNVISHPAVLARVDVDGYAVKREELEVVDGTSTEAETETARRETE